MENLEDQKIQENQRVQEEQKDACQRKGSLKAYLRVFALTAAGMGILFLFQFLGEGAVAIRTLLEGKAIEEMVELYKNDMILIVLISDILAFFTVWRLLKRKKIDPFREGGFQRKNSFKRLIISSFTALFGFMASNLLVNLLPVSFYNNAQEFSQSFGQMSEFSSGLSIFLLFLSLCVTGPAAEELIFRGLPVFVGRREGAKDWVCIGIGALVFGLAHWMTGGLGLVISGTVLGFLFGLIFFQSGSLKADMIAHGIVNFPAFLALIFMPDQLSTELPGPSLEALKVTILPIFLYTGLTILGIRWLKNHPAEELPPKPAQGEMTDQDRPSREEVSNS